MSKYEASTFSMYCTNDNVKLQHTKFSKKNITYHLLACMNNYHKKEQKQCSSKKLPQTIRTRICDNQKDAIRTVSDHL